MKTKFKSMLFLLALAGIMNLFSINCFAGKDEPPVVDEQCTLSTTVELFVTLNPDCTAMDSCQFEILVYDVDVCTQNTPYIAIQDYVYNTTNYFGYLTFNYSQVRVCVRLKPGTHCDYTNYAPKCVCLPLDPPRMILNIDICTP